MSHLTDEFKCRHGRIGDTHELEAVREMAYHGSDGGREDYIERGGGEDRWALPARQIDPKRHPRERDERIGP